MVDILCQTWLNPVLDLVVILSFKKGGIHHPFDLFPQSEHQLQAAQKDADTGDDQDGTDYDVKTRLIMTVAGIDLLMMNKPANLY